MPEEPTHGPVVAGAVAAVVGFSSSFVVVLAGLTAVGASPGQAASGLAVLCVAQALGMLWLSLRHRIPVSLAWSTPGAALLASTAGVAGGWPAAVGAFLATAALLVATALVPRIGDLVGSIPVSIAQAMLAGVLLPLCLAPVTALVDSPAVVAPVVVTWLLLLRVARRWAVPGALAAALVTVLVTAGGAVPAGDLVPSLTWTAPTWSTGAMVGVALPLYVVTMASQNVPGAAVMAGFGYRLPWRESLAVTGIATAAAAPAGGHAVNLAAITAALTAGPAAGPDPARRWLATTSAAATYLVLAAGSTALAAVVTAAPSGVVQAAAGLALLGTLAGSLATALSDPADREGPVVTALVAASGMTLAGIGAAFWALLAGLLVRAVVRAPGSRTGPAPARVAPVSPAGTRSTSDRT